MKVSHEALSHTVLPEASVEFIYQAIAAHPDEQHKKAIRKKLCLSHERLRAELEGAMVLLNTQKDTPTVEV